MINKMCCGKISYKEVTVWTILAGVALGFNIIFWRQMRHLFLTELLHYDAINLKFILIAILSFATLSASVILTSILAKNIWVMLAISLLSTVGILFLPLATPINALSCVIAFLVTLATIALMRRNITLHTKLVLGHIFGSGLNWFILFFSLLISAQFYFIASAQLGTTQLRITDEYLDGLLKYSEPLIEKQVELQEKIITEALLKSIERDLPYLADLPDSDKVALLHGDLTQATHDKFVAAGLSEAQINDIVRQITEQLNINTESDSQQSLTQSFLDQAKTQLTDLANDFIDSNKGVIPWILSAFTFLTFTSLSIFVRYAALLITKALLILMNSTGLIQKSAVPIPVERYVISNTEASIPNEHEAERH